MLLDPQGTSVKHCLIALAACLGLVGAARANEAVDHAMVGKIRQEAFHRSQVMQTLSQLTEDVGPRLTNSPGMAKANAWARERLSGWGLANVHDEAFGPFGRGWEFRTASVEVIAPRPFPLHALPKAWTPGTAGPVEGEAMAVTLKTQADLDKHRGKLRGKILFLDAAREYKPGDKPDSDRYDNHELDELRDFTIPKDRDPAKRAKDAKERLDEIALTAATNAFFAEEGVLATVSISSWDNGIIRLGGGGSRKAGEAVGVPALTMMAEHYNTVMRALERKQAMRLRVNVDARFTGDTDEMGYNTLAEIPGHGSLKDEVVIIGAHLDSWHAGTGAADNGAGVAVMMEAMRILKATGAKPRRTIRIALWGGEEQGLLGSSDYVTRHYGGWPEPTDPQQKKLPLSLREPTGPLQRKRGYDTVAAYFNYDNGGGRIRGIYTQENTAVAPIFAAWLAPLNDVGATTVTHRNTGSTDHVPFDRIGLPGFQFVQDRLDYFSNVHHSHLDVLDHVVPEDLKQSAAVVATFAWHAATREEKLPRMPVRDP